VEFKIQNIIEKMTLFADGALGTPIFTRHPLRKVPFTMSSKAAFINGKQALAASLKSLSLVSSFFLVTYTHHVLLLSWTNHINDAENLKYKFNTGRSISPIQ